MRHGSKCFCWFISVIQLVILGLVVFEVIRLGQEVSYLEKALVEFAK